MNSKISRVLNKITASYPKSIMVSDLLFSGIDKQELLIILRFIDLFNTIKFEPKELKLESVITVKSVYANIFLKSLSLYIKNDYKMIRSWETNSTLKHLDPCLYLNQGINLTYSLEHQRFMHYHDSTPTRTVKASIAIIKIKPTGKKEEYYLVQYDTDSQTYKFLGGKKIPEDKNPQDTLIRELEEKLPSSMLVPDRDYKIFPVIYDLETVYLSNSNAAVSQFKFDVFEIVLKKDLKLTPSERWVTLEEILDGETKDGVTIGNKQFDNLLNKSIKGGLKSLRTSFQYSDKYIKNNKLTTAEEIKHGETKRLEFKSSARWDYNAKKVNTQLQEVIAKSISGFMNLDGGKIYIGVKDDKTILGIEQDVLTLKNKNLDGFSLLINQIIEAYIGVELAELVDVSYKKVDKKTICILEIKESPKPVFVKIDNTKHFFVRMGNSTKKLDSEETYNFIRYHW